MQKENIELSIGVGYTYANNSFFKPNSYTKKEKLENAIPKSNFHLYERKLVEGSFAKY